MKNHDLSPQLELQKLREIGAYLHQIRLERKISLDAIAARTLIPKRLLIAIEKGNAAELPEPFYIKALINKFARSIGAELPEFTLVATDKNNKQAASAKKAATKQHPFNFQLRSLHLYLFYILLVGLSVKGIAGLVERPVVIEQANQSNLENTSTTDTDASETAVQSSERIQRRETNSSLLESPGSAGKTNASVEKNAPTLVVDRSSQSQSVNVVVDLSDRCWLKVKVDGETVFEDTLPKGTKKTWTGEEKVTIVAGNAGGVAVTFNDEKQAILGKKGEVKEVTYAVN